MDPMDLPNKILIFLNTLDGYTDATEYEKKRGQSVKINTHTHTHTHTLSLTHTHIVRMRMCMCVCSIICCGSASIIF